MRTSHRALLGISALVASLAACASSESSDPKDGVGPSSPNADASSLDPNEGGASSDAGSRCQETADAITCTSHELSLDVQGTPRKIAYEVPLGTPPAKGWPVVIYFQGSFVPGIGAFKGKKSDPFGIFNLAATVKELLDHGYAVLAPNAMLDGTAAWQTNVPPWSELWATSSDDPFMHKIFDSIGAGAFGPLDGSRLFAMGISSGGFMTSRMAVSYAGKFRSLVIHSGSYATCSATCTLPPKLPTDHPPTLFVHGGADNVVAPSMMALYRDALAAQGHVVDTLMDPKAGHEWLAIAAPAIRAWFDAHP